MADTDAAPKSSGRLGAWTAEQVALALVSRRDRLVSRLPEEIAAARSLSADQRELVIDEALDFVVTEYARPISDDEALERAFWATVSNRVKRAREGRSATVRGGWNRVDVDQLQFPRARRLQKSSRSKGRSEPCSWSSRRP
jgi:hypothetical protein